MLRKTPFKRKPYQWKRKPKSESAEKGNSKKPSAPSRSSVMRKADAAFSLFIRTRDSQQFHGKAFRCISCGQVLPIGQADCGHYVNRKHMALRFSELNCNAQCRQCNRFDEGNIQEYRRGLISKIGESKVTMLESLKHTSHYLSVMDMEYIARHYKEETKDFEYQIK